MTMTATKAVAGKKVSFAKILVATDFSPVSNTAVDYALAIARRYDSHVFLTHVVNVDAYPMVAPELAISSIQKLRNKAELEFGYLLESGKLRGIAHEVIVEEGTLWPTIEKLIEKNNIDLVVVGTHGAGGIRKLVLGSGAEEIFRHARLPVLTVGPSAKSEVPKEEEFKNILFATDFGPGAEREAAYAFSLAQENGARLTLFNVVPHVEEYSTEAVARKREQVVRQLKELLPLEADLWCKPEFLMAIGEPVEEILKLAKKIDADLIVMGAKPRKNLAGNIPHTKASRIVAGAASPVLTIKS
ncbi:MAG TPA: universal stress protein [archaeon]|nr:universal stress protein [archaeon]